MRRCGNLQPSSYAFHAHTAPCLYSGRRQVTVLQKGYSASRIAAAAAAAAITAAAGGAAGAVMLLPGAAATAVVTAALLLCWHNDDGPFAVVCAVLCYTAQEELSHTTLQIITKRQAAATAITICSESVEPRVPSIMSIHAEKVYRCLNRTNSCIAGQCRNTQVQDGPSF